LDIALMRVIFEMVIRRGRRWWRDVL